MFIDYLQNGRPYGAVAEQLASCRFDPGLLRPYIDGQGRRCVSLAVGNKLEKRYIAELQAQGISSPVFNATSLRKDEWIQIDSVVVKAARSRLRAWADLAAANTFGGFNGMSKTILEYETMSDPGEAIVDMDGLTEGRNDAPQYQLEGLPLAITHSDFWFSARRLATSRNSGTPLDTTMAEAAGRRVAESVERTLIGVDTGLTFGSASANGYGRSSSIYGYTNFPDRITKTDLTTPTGANPEAIVNDVLEMRDLLYQSGFYGPFVLYHSTPYDLYLDNDYYRTGGTSVLQTVRQRMLAIDGITAVRRLDYLTSGYVLIMVQMTSDVARAVNGMNLTTVQWESQGGMRLNFKVMTIMVPQLRSDFNGNSGIVHATTA